MVDSSTSEQVVQTVAERSAIGALDLPPLFDTLDPDALDTLVREMDEGQVSFVYAGYDITVDSRGAIAVDKQLPSGGTVREAAPDDD